MFLTIRMISKQDAEIKDILVQIRDILKKREDDQRAYNQFVATMMELKGTHDYMMRKGGANPHRDQS